MIFNKTIFRFFFVISKNESRATQLQQLTCLIPTVESDVSINMLNAFLALLSEVCGNRKRCKQISNSRSVNEQLQLQLQLHVVVM